MKFSLNLTKEHSNVDMTSFDRDEIVSRIGLQLGAIEEVKDYSERYQGTVVVKVLSCEKHPDADKLSLCLVDDGGVTSGVERNDEGLVQVVCGAPNVRADIYAAWIPPGNVIPSTVDTDDPFTLEVRKIRGQMSNGMLASLKELDINDDHDGILLLTPENAGADVTPGDPLAPLLGLDDFVVDCENKMFTHRPDCFGNIGISRELAGIFDQNFVSPEWYAESPDFEKADALQLNITNPINEQVARFVAVAIEGVAIKQSPLWMQAYLKRLGMQPINNIVDITNYVMHLTGQPLHAFDYDKLLALSNEPSLGPRMAKVGEKIALLNGKTIELTDQDMVIATDKEAVAVAGIMGGSDTEVDEHTTRIVFECATFDMYAVRRTSMRHGLFTDALTRFNKGQSPLQNDRALYYAMKLARSNANAQQASQVYDLASFDRDADNLNHVSVGVGFVNSRLGAELSAEQMSQLLSNVEFEVAVEGETLNITVPFWRMDIAISEDIVEEVGRLYGYNKLDAKVPSRLSAAVPLNERREFQQSLRDQLTALGASEVLTYSFVHADLLEKCGIKAEEWSYHIRNAISPDLQYYRPCLVPSLLQKVHGNIKAQAGSDDNVFALYEFGKAHVKGHFEEDEPGLPAQMHRMSLVVAADDKAAKDTDDPYYYAKQVIDLLSDGQATYEPLETNDYPITAPYQIGRSAQVKIGDSVFGVVGEIRTAVVRKLKLPKFCAAFELDMDIFKEKLATTTYQPLSRFQSAGQDITLEVKADASWADLYTLLSAELNVLSAQSDLQSDINPASIYQPDDTHVRVSFHVQVAHHERTLRTSEITELLESLANVAKDKLGATRV